MEKLVHQARLSHSRLADDRHYLTASLSGELLRGEKLNELYVSADETRQAVPGSGLEARSRGAGARYLVDLYRIGEPLYRHGAEGLDGDVACGQSDSVGRRKHRTGLCHLFHATGQMRRLAHYRVIHMKVIADRGDDDFPRVEPDADRHLYSMRALNLVGIPADALLHRQPRITRAHGMILDGERCAKEGHDPVAHDPVHGAFVAVHRLDHAIKHRVEQEHLRDLRVAVDQQLHRTFDIGEQHGDLLALTLKGRSRGKDLFGQVPRRVTLGRGKPAGDIRDGGQGMATFGAELGCG